MDWTSVVIALGGLGATVSTVLLTLRHGRRTDELRYRRESYRAAYLEYLSALEEAQYRVAPLGGVNVAELNEDLRALLKKVEVARVAVDMYGPQPLRDAAYESSLAVHELARSDLSKEQRREARGRLHKSRATLVDTVRVEVSPEES